MNVSRGALVDEAALVETIVEGRIARAGLDVYSVEPLAHAGHPMSARRPTRKGARAGALARMRRRRIARGRRAAHEVKR